MTTWVWREALEMLRHVLPGSTGFQLDQIQGIPSDAWRRFRLDDDDVTVGERLVAEVGTVLGEDLRVVTDASWRPDVGPFMLPAWRLSTLIRDHAERNGESFFHGDVVILSPTDGAVVAVHPAGMLAVAHGEPVCLPPSWPLAHVSGTAVFARLEPALEWTYKIGEIYPDSALTLPSGRTVDVRWFEPDPQVSFVAPTGDFQISYRGPLERAEEVLTEVLAVLGLSERDVLRLSPRPAQT